MKQINFIINKNLKKLIFVAFIFLIGNLNAQFCMTPTQTVALFPTTTTQTTAAYSTGAICFTFNATSGCTYGMATCNLSNDDTYLRLYSGIGAVLIGGYDDQCGSGQSSFVWTCPTTGIYSVLMNDWSCASLVGSTALSYSTSCASSLCSGTPNSGVAAISSASGCPSTNFNLSATGLTSASGLTYQWQSSSSVSGPFANILTGTTASFGTNTTTTTYYRIITTCTASALSATSTVISYSVVNPGPCVCNAYPSATILYPYDEEILNVSFGTLNNVSTCTSVGPGPGSINQRYSNYSGFVAAPNVCKGAAIPFTVNIGTCGGWYGMSLAIYIDYNQNGVFTDSGELVYSNTNAIQGNSTGTITIPTTALAGTTRMRIVANEGTGSIPPSASTSLYYGETEDYCVNLLNGPQITATGGSVCPGAPFVITPSGSSTYTYYASSGILGNGSSFTVNPITSTSYSIAGTGTNGCITTSNSAQTGTLTVSLLQSPVLVATSTPTAYCDGGSAVLNVSGANTYTWTSPSSNSNAVTVTPSVTTVYTVSGTGTNVCNGVVAVTVVVNQIPTVTVNSGTLCTGYSLTMVPSGASTYTLFSSTGTVGTVLSPSATTNYSIIGTSSAGCNSSPSTPGTSTIVVIPSPTIIASSGTVCIGSNYTIAPTGANNTYSINGVANGGTSTPLSFSPAVNTTYSITGTNTNGCVSFSPAVINVSVVALPTVAVSTSTSAICISQATANLSATGANTYTWTGGSTGASVAVSPTTTTIFMVTGTSTLLCNNSATVSVTVLSLPPVTAATNKNFVCVAGGSTLTAGGANTYSWSNGTASLNTVVNPTINATYTVVGTDLNGCRNTATVGVQVNTIVMNVAPTSTSVCLGSSVTFTASGAATYTWNGTINFATYLATPTTATVYTVTATDANLCPQVKTVLASVYQLPIVTSSITRTLICLKETATITASGANSYSWSSGAATSSIVVSPTIDLTYIYTAVGTDSNNCTGTTTQTLAVSKCTGLEKTLAENNLVNVFPNPSTGVFNIELNSSNVKEIQVIDLTGRLIYTDKSNSNKVSINLNAYPAGVYYLKVSADHSVKTIKLIKE